MMGKLRVGIQNSTQLLFFLKVTIILIREGLKTYLHFIDTFSCRYTPAEFPVLAFTGPPAPFPVQKQHVRLQQYLKWSDKMAAAVQEFIVKHIPGPFLGLHLRNGIDFVSI